MLEGAHVAFFEAPRLFPGAPFPLKARSWGLIWPEACAWRNDMFNIPARLKDKPDMLSPHQTFYGTPPAPREIPFLKSGCRYINGTVKSAPEAELCCYLNGGTTRRTAARFCSRLVTGATSATSRGATRGRPSLETGTPR